MDRRKALFWSLVEPEHVRARAFCRKLMRNREDGDDLYQDSLVSALTRFHRLRQTKSFRAWLYRIIINGHASKMRRPWRRQLVPLDEQIEQTVGGDNPLAVFAIPTCSSATASCCGSVYLVAHRAKAEA